MPPERTPPRHVRSAFLSGGVVERISRHATLNAVYTLMHHRHQPLLTSLGESFLRDAQEILRLTYVAEERARRQSSGNDLVIAYSDANELMRLAPVLDRMRKERENLHVLLQQGPRDNNVTRLARKQVDVVFGFKSKPLVTGGVGFTSLISSGLSCIVRIDSPLAQHETLGPEDVEGMPQILCLPPSVRRHGTAAQSDIPATDAASTIRCSNSSEAYCLVDAGFGYALIPSLYTMPDPFHKVIDWRGHAQAAYGIYQRIGERGGVVASFAQAACEVFGQPDFARPLSETWRIAAQATA